MMGVTHVNVKFPQVLQPYKYAGYPMLIKTIVAETNDHHLFSNEHTVLPSACELCFFTIANSALNAEELRYFNHFFLGIYVIVISNHQY